MTIFQIAAVYVLFLPPHNTMAAARQSRPPVPGKYISAARINCKKQFTYMAYLRVVSSLMKEIDCPYDSNKYGLKYATTMQDVR